MTASASTTDLRRQLDQLQAELSSRSSTVHFAHAAVSLAVSLILFGGVGKLAWDLGDKLPGWVGAGTGLSGLILVYALIRWALARRELRAELEKLKALEALRRELKLDDPAALLPQ